MIKVGYATSVNRTPKMMTDPILLHEKTCVGPKLAFKTKGVRSRLLRHYEMNYRLSNHCHPIY